MLNVMFFQLRYNAITRSQNKNFWPFKWPYNISVVFYINYIYFSSTHNTCKINYEIYLTKAVGIKGKT